MRSRLLAGVLVLNEHHHRLKLWPRLSSIALFASKHLERLTGALGNVAAFCGTCALVLFLVLLTLTERDE